ncbi:hypothetical protein SBOR_3429 [Sclerotinia borealis F-4128]|uniref:Uncharacterized protein n=1 Tax=Sclerotinia borealis (strain F-4128) TaxID=1432307 RepID=W9CNB9_SCLBF|nr:hypothetical protein SBOR_3429 [Sclerotinia borealis F-4128]
MSKFDLNIQETYIILEAALEPSKMGIPLPWLWFMFGKVSLLLHQIANPYVCSRSDPQDPSYKTIKWSGIQNSLEEAQSDVLLLLDCCSSGTADTGDGCGTTELIAACGFNDVANGVGSHSFTSALITELKLLISNPKFTAAVLYSRILCRVQNWMPKGRELQKAPLHVVLTQNPALPSSIQLSVKPRPISPSLDPSQSPGSASPASRSSNQMTDCDQGSGSSPMSSLLSAEAQFPRILLSVRLKEDLVPASSADLFADWLRTMPIIVESFNVEAGFRSFSTLLFVSMSTPIWVCLGRDAAISLVGIIRKETNAESGPIPTSLRAQLAESKLIRPLETEHPPSVPTADKPSTSASLEQSSTETLTLPKPGDHYSLLSSETDTAPVIPSSVHIDKVQTPSAISDIAFAPEISFDYDYPMKSRAFGEAMRVLHKSREVIVMEGLESGLSVIEEPNLRRKFDELSRAIEVLYKEEVRLSRTQEVNKKM